MHGVKKSSGSDEEKAKQDAIVAKKIEKYQQLLATLKQKRDKKECDDQSIKFTSELLSVNGECYTMWNFRRQTLLSKFNEISEEEQINMLNKELAFTEQTISKNAKSYWCWNQREWATTRLHSFSKCDWNKELQLCSKFLKYDARNFHCWNYRRYVTRQSEVSNNDELGFTMSLIEENFSNYSAWHQRSKLLPLIFTEKSEFIQAISDELEIVQNAFYTMPNDSSAWFYHRWLINQNPTKEVVLGELEKLEELLEILESNEEKKWPKLTKVFLLKHLEGHEGEIKQILQELTEVDPLRANYYKSLLCKE